MCGVAVGGPRMCDRWEGQSQATEIEVRPPGAAGAGVSAVGPRPAGDPAGQVGEGRGPWGRSPCAGGSSNMQIIGEMTSPKLVWGPAF